MTYLTESLQNFKLFQTKENMSHFKKIPKESNLTFLRNYSFTFKMILYIYQNISHINTH